MRIPKDSWSITEKIIKRYPEQKKIYSDLREEILTASPFNDGQPRGNGTGNPTERKALSLNDARLQRMEREITAVEKAYNSLSGSWQKIVTVRFWSNRWKNMPYTWAEATTNYSSRQIRRVSKLFIEQVAQNLGEI